MTTTINGTITSPAGHNYVSVKLNLDTKFTCSGCAETSDDTEHDFHLMTYISTDIAPNLIDEPPAIRINERVLPSRVLCSGCALDVVLSTHSDHFEISF